MDELKALIFDVDGTLADTERDGHRVAFNQAFATAGLDWCWDVEMYGELLKISGGEERMRHYLEGSSGKDYKLKHVQDMIPGLHAAKNRIYSEMIEQGRIALRPGIRRLLHEARSAGLRLAIATTTSRVNVMALLEKTLHPDAPSWFEVIATADEIPDKKPSPAVYVYVLKAMQLDPRQCLAFEDSENGLKASRRAGIRAIIAVNDYTRTGDYTGALLVLNHLGEPGQPFTILGGQAAGLMPVQNGHISAGLLQKLTWQK